MICYIMIQLNYSKIASDMPLILSRIWLTGFSAFEWLVADADDEKKLKCVNKWKSSVESLNFIISFKPVYPKKIDTCN